MYNTDIPQNEALSVCLLCRNKARERQDKLK